MDFKIDIRILILSLFVHLGFYGFLSLLQNSSPKTDHDSTIEISIQDENPSKQYVLNPTKQNSIAHDSTPTPYLSNQTQRYKKQTISDNLGAPQNAQEFSKTIQTSHSRGQIKDDKNSSAQNSTASKASESKPLSLPKNPYEEKDFNQNNNLNLMVAREDSLTNDSINIRNRNDIERLKKYNALSTQDKSQSSSQDQRQSAINFQAPNISRGEFTFLNSDFSTYASFYNRITPPIVYNWGNNIEDLALFPHMKEKLRTKAVWTTKIELILDKEGYYLNTLITHSSGSAELDQAIAGALKNASPFYNPPSGMIEPDGTIHISGEFNLYTRRPRLAY